HRAAMGMTAAGRIRVGGEIGRLVSPPRVIANIPSVMSMIGNRLDVVEGILIEVLASLPLIPRSLNDVIQMRNDAGRTECLTLIVEVHTPRVTGPPRENVEN